MVSRVSQTAYMAINEICFWTMGIGVVIVVLFWERQSLRSIGLRRLTVKEGLLSLLLGILLFILVPTLGILIERLFGIMTSTMRVVAALAKYPIWLRALFAARPGFVEEILYRGYPIERLNRLTGSIWLGALISLIIHTAIHIPPLGLGHTIGVVFPISAILTGLYVWKRNLTLNITVHFLIDFLALVLLPLLPQLS
jgi:membrane protease YdiL (CAAX protease family)